MPTTTNTKNPAPTIGPRSKRKKKDPPVDWTATLPEAIAHVGPKRWDLWKEDGFPIQHLRLRLGAVGDDGAAASIVEPLAEEPVDLLKRHDAGVAIELFLSEDAAWASQLERLATLRCLELLDGLNGPPLPFPGLAPSGEDVHLRYRVLNPVESANLRLASRSNTQRQALLGFMEETATSGEIAGTTTDAIELGAGGTAQALLPGVRSSGGIAVADRVIKLSGVGANAVSTLLRRHGAAGRPATSHWLVNSRQGIGSQKLADAIGMVATALMREAGLKGDPTVAPMSIRNTAGRRIYAAGGLEAAALRMGLLNRFDDLRTQIGLQPWPAPRSR